MALTGAGCTGFAVGMLRIDLLVCGAYLVVNMRTTSFVLIYIYQLMGWLFKNRFSFLGQLPELMQLILL
jgi:hypothetical protein